jgi:uncharacterized protein
MMKIVVLIAVVALVLWLLSAARRRSGRGDEAPPVQPRRGRRGDAAEPTPMLACAHCGVHLPRAEAVEDATGRVFCSDAHRLAGPRHP